MTAATSATPASDPRVEVACYLVYPSAPADEQGAETVVARVECVDARQGLWRVRVGARLLTRAGAWVPETSDAQECLFGREEALALATAHVDGARRDRGPLRRTRRARGQLPAQRSVANPRRTRA